jgi:hypothetical protein
VDQVDLKRTIRSYAAPRGRFEIVSVPPLSYAMIDGEGDPDVAPAYADAVGSLFGVSYKLKFLARAELGRDHVVMPLEALWWADDMESFTTARDKSRWHWTVMILVPFWIPGVLFERAVGVVGATGTHPGVDRMRLESLDEGRCVQTLHVGSYDDEAPVLARMHDEFVPAEGLALRGRHHEIYLSDARRTAPEKLRTILRQPVVARDEG